MFGTLSEDKLRARNIPIFSEVDRALSSQKVCTFELCLVPITQC